MSSPVAIVDGLVKRDLRRWCGRRESSFVYHWAKRSALPLRVLTWVIYLVLPCSLHRSFVVLPFATLLALSVAVTASTLPDQERAVLTQDGPGRRAHPDPALR